VYTVASPVSDDTIFIHEDPWYKNDGFGFGGLFQPCGVNGDVKEWKRQNGILFNSASVHPALLSESAPNVCTSASM